MLCLCLESLGENYVNESYFLHETLDCVYQSSRRHLAKIVFKKERGLCDFFVSLERGAFHWNTLNQLRAQVFQVIIIKVG